LADLSSIQVGKMLMDDLRFTSIPDGGCLSRGKISTTLEEKVLKLPVDAFS
jgi:hypothetical protein